MKIIRIPTLVAGVILLAASLISAQNYEPSEYLELVRVHVRPGANAQFEDYVKKLGEAADELGAAQSWLGSEVMLGGRGNTYIFALNFAKWEEVDSWDSIPQMLVKAFGENEGMQILKSGASAIEESHTRVYRYLPDQSSTIGLMPADMKAARLTVTEIKPDSIFAYNAAMVKAREAANKTADAPKAIRRISVDGPSFTYLSASLVKSHAERDSWLGPGEAILKVYGEYEGRKIIDTILGSMVSNMSVVLASRPDLSRAASAASTTN